jgi:hypothetical protein
MTAISPARDADFEPVYHHGPHRAGLPRLISCIHELWRRRAFRGEMSSATIRGKTAAAWALASAVIGFPYFISREREFAVRLV